MIADGLWVPHARRKPQVYQPRYRRDCLGELIQIDGSHHERDRDGQRERSKSMPKRRAQATIQEQLKAINPFLANPEEFRASLKR